MIDSIGTLYAIQDLFDDLEKRSIQQSEFLQAFSKYGTSTAQDVYDTALRLNWLCAAETGQLVPTHFGKQAHAGTDRQTRLRHQLQNVIEQFKPPWAALLVRGRREAEASFPPAVLQCFEEAGLLGPLSEEIVGWWDSLAGLMREAHSRALLEVGREGERQSVSYEQNRTGATAKWKSVETNFAGYDVLSVQSRTDGRHLKVEVKASSLKFRDAAINVTEHEWRTASVQPSEYVFHVWIFSDWPSKTGDLHVLQFSDVAKHIPKNVGKGMWRQVAIPVSALTRPERAVHRLR